MCLWAVPGEADKKLIKAPIDLCSFFKPSRLHHNLKGGKVSKLAKIPYKRPHTKKVREKNEKEKKRKYVPLHFTDDDTATESAPTCKTLMLMISFKILVI
eukprot:Pgem_evm1s19711